MKLTTGAEVTGVSNMPMNGSPLMGLMTSFCRKSGGRSTRPQPGRTNLQNPDLRIGEPQAVVVINLFLASRAPAIACSVLLRSAAGRDSLATRAGGQLEGALSAPSGPQRE